MTRRRFRSTVAVLLAAAVGVLGGQAVASSRWMAPPLDGGNTLISGCVIRFDTDKGTPRIHANYSHTCAGVEKVSIENGNVRIDQTRTGAPIVSAIVTADETLVARGIQAGASGGGPVTVVKLYDAKLGRLLNLNSQSDRNRVKGSGSNLWLLWVHGKR